MGTELDEIKKQFFNRNGFSTVQGDLIKGIFQKRTEQPWESAFVVAQSEEEVLKALPIHLHMKWEEVKVWLSEDAFDNNPSLKTDQKFLDETYDRIRHYITKHTDSKQVLYRAKNPLSLEQTLFMTRDMTERFSMPVVVWPECDEAEETFKINHYCKVKAKITNEMDAFPYRIELFKTFRVKVGETTSYFMGFMADKTNKPGHIDPGLAFNIDRFVNMAEVGGKKVVLLSSKKLTVGEEYIVKGLSFDVNRMFDMKISIGAKQTCMMVDDIHEVGIWHLSPKVIAKSVGKDLEWFMRSVMYPFHNTIEDYAMLSTLQFFHIYTGFPFNSLTIGPPQSGKSSLFKKIEAITGEDMLSAGAGTTKGLMPTFSTNNVDAGYLATCKYKATVNEFFNYFVGSGVNDKIDFMSKTKDMLEGMPVTFRSGNGRMKVHMTADFMGAGNPPHKQGSGFYNNVMEFYEDLDTAMLDRILFYWQPNEQNKIVDAHKHEALGILHSAQNNFHKIDYGDLLDCNDLMNILSWCKKAKYVTKENDYLGDEAKELGANIPSGIFTRYYDFMLNASTAFAVIRMLSKGLLTPDSDTIVLEKEDIRNGRLFIQNMINMYIGEEDGIALRFKAIKSLTPAQSKVFGMLNTQWARSEDKYARMMSITDLAQVCGGDSALIEVLEHLRIKHLAVYSKTKAMHFPDMSAEALKIYDDVVHGFQPDAKDIAFSLVKKGLFIYDDTIQKFICPWIVLSDYVSDDDPKILKRLEQLCTFLELGIDRSRTETFRSYEDCYRKGFSDSIINKGKKMGRIEEPVRNKLRTIREDNA